MPIFWLSISLIVGGISGYLFYYSSKLRKADQQLWDEFTTKLNDQATFEIPEEMVYELLLKIHKGSLIALLISVAVAILCVSDLILR